MGDARHHQRWRERRGCGCGCAGFFIVITLGLLLALLHAVLALGVSVGVPFTSSNITLAASIGTKEQVANALPEYTHGRLGGNQNFINQSQMLTVGPAEGAVLLVIGRQPGAPPIDLHLVLH